MAHLEFKCHWRSCCIWGSACEDQWRNKVTGSPRETRRCGGCKSQPDVPTAARLGQAGNQEAAGTGELAKPWPFWKVSPLQASLEMREGEPKGTPDQTGPISQRQTARSRVHAADHLRCLPCPWLSLLMSHFPRTSQEGSRHCVGQAGES